MKEIPLTKGYVALVDDEDYPALIKFKWYANESKRKNNRIVVYAERSTWDGKLKKRYNYSMHRDLIKTPLQVDHKDGNGLNNQRNNLRPATRAQQQANSISTKGTSKYKGVIWHSQCKKWVARIKYNFKTIYIGIFNQEADAAQAYNFKAEELFGEFARLNEAESRKLTKVASV